MALQSLAGGLFQYPTLQFTSDGQQSQTIDANGEYVAAIMLNPIARTIRGFTVNVTGVTAAGDLVFTAETVSANLPSGTLVDASATTTVTVSATGLTKADFGADITLPVGCVAFRVRRVSGTFNGTVLALEAITSRITPPHLVLVGGTVDQRVPNLAAPFSGIPPDETYLAFPWAVPCNSGTGAPGLGANNEGGCLIAVPFKARACGVAFFGRQNTGAPSQNPEARLYADDGSTLLASGAVLLATGKLWPHHAHFDTPVELAAGSSYYAIIHGFDSTNTINLITWGLLDRAMAGTVGLGHYVSRTGSSGAFSDNDAVPRMALVLDQLDDGRATASQTILGII